MALIESLREALAESRKEAGRLRTELAEARAALSVAVSGNYGDAPF